jgi:hypothetical protein
MSELAEGARLEIACTANRGTEGSNPSLSAILFKCVVFTDLQYPQDFLKGRLTS